MAWKNLSAPAIASRRRAVATALVYGLSLTVRFTSAAGEEAESGASHAKRQSHDFHHAQRCLLQWLAAEARTADRLYARLAVEFQSLPRGM